MLMGGRAEGLACADPGLRTPIGMSGNYTRSGNMHAVLIVYMIIIIWGKLINVLRVVLLWCGNMNVS